MQQIIVIMILTFCFSQDILSEKLTIYYTDIYLNCGKNYYRKRHFDTTFFAVLYRNMA